MNLTTEQQQAIENGEPVELMVGGKRCVLLPWELYEQFSDTPLSSPITAALIRNTMAAEDADDPLLDSYQPLKKLP